MDVVAQARIEKNRAMDERDLGNWEGALEILDGSKNGLLKVLNDLESRAGDSDSQLRDFKTAVEKQLYYLLGSIGGVYRRRAATPDRQPGDLEAAIKSYDEGARIEVLFTDSYNLIQRLVTRALLHPAAVLDESAVVQGIGLRQELRKAKGTLDVQTRNGGPRENDEYAFADILIDAVLLGEPTWRDAIHEFTRRAPKTSYARSVTLEVMRELLAGAERGGADAAPLRERMEEALRLTEG
jgi:hypothetical protein